MSNWPFDQARNCGTPVSRAVFEGSTFISYAVHLDDDHSWMFLDDDTDDPKDAMLVCLENVLELDPTIVEVANLPPGWYATRAAVGAPWQRHKSEE